MNAQEAQITELKQRVAYLEGQIAMMHTLLNKPLQAPPYSAPYPLPDNGLASK